MELDSKLWMSSVRVKVWHCLQDKDILDRIVKERSQARVNVVDMKVMCWGGSQSGAGQGGDSVNHILGIKPTGWTHSRGEGQESSLAGLQTPTQSWP